MRRWCSRTPPKRASSRRRRCGTSAKAPCAPRASLTCSADAFTCRTPSSQSSTPSSASTSSPSASPSTSSGAPTKPRRNRGASGRSSSGAFWRRRRGPPRACAAAEEAGREASAATTTGAAGAGVSFCRSGRCARGRAAAEAPLARLASSSSARTSSPRACLSRTRSRSSSGAHARTRRAGTERGSRCSREAQQPRSSSLTEFSSREPPLRRRSTPRCGRRGTAPANSSEHEHFKPCQPPLFFF
mmetsp:Transcript_15597/g.51229  ORF Transcript_15597/g.51229 Transcript_15597/m.51229 type:complete len:244 (+) Transcript_15597:746-1477(+)